VLELPTAIIEGSGGRQVDTRTLDALRLSRFPGIGGKLVQAAEQVRGLLRLGKVYVGPQPTGIADITLVVGKDYSQG
jgi:hypothetical protein